MGELSQIVTAESNGLGLSAKFGLHHARGLTGGEQWCNWERDQI